MAQVLAFHQIAAPDVDHSLCRHTCPQRLFKKSRMPFFPDPGLR
jgi:hypothetical protein